MNEKELSRVLLEALRHDPALLGITLDANGWAGIPNVARGVEQQFGEMHIEELKASITALLRSERIEISEHGIRATYGGSLTRENQPPNIPSCRLFHGTQVSIYRKVERRGLLPKKREQVHLTSSIDYAQAIADKWQDGLVLEIDVKKALAGGIAFTQANSHVWFAGHIPAEYLMAY